MIYVEAPHTLWESHRTEFQAGALAPPPSVFMAGGITGCPDWQQGLRGLLKKANVILINPRRANFPIGDPSAAEAQITWEFDHLRQADAISFWFPKETLCPIVLYELGKHSAPGALYAKALFVGVEPGYQREQDVRIQTRLARPDVLVRSSLADLAIDITHWLAK